MCEVRGTRTSRANGERQFAVSSAVRGALPRTAMRRTGSQHTVSSDLAVAIREQRPGSCELPIIGVTEYERPARTSDDDRPARTNAIRSIVPSVGATWDDLVVRIEPRPIPSFGGSTVPTRGRGHHISRDGYPDGATQNNNTIPVTISATIRTPMATIIAVDRSPVVTGGAHSARNSGPRL